MEKQEIWKPIERYEGIYEVSNLGRVRNIVRGNIKKPQSSGIGYTKMFLYKDGKGEQFFVHRLVAKAFVPNPDNKPYVNHIDETRDNNVASNLEWVTHQENLTRGTVQKRKVVGMKRFYENGGISKRCRAVRCIENGIVYPSIAYASKATDAFTANIHKCIIGERHTAGGYHWEYAQGE